MDLCLEIFNGRDDANNRKSREAIVPNSNPVAHLEMLYNEKIRSHFMMRRADDYISRVFKSTKSINPVQTNIDWLKALISFMSEKQTKDNCEIYPGGTERFLLIFIPLVFMMDFDSTAGVRYGDPDFEETLLKWADEVDEDDRDIDSDDETSIGASTENYFYGKNRFKWSKVPPYSKNTRFVSGFYQNLANCSQSKRKIKSATKSRPQQKQLNKHRHRRSRTTNTCYRTDEEQLRETPSAVSDAFLTWLSDTADMSLPRPRTFPDFNPPYHSADMMVEATLRTYKEKRMSRFQAQTASRV
ncbi:unnamed protein product [Acanthoscelides obtectus]|uniref:Uncharacterized protein n=1 Tax=Acanthoscelides obtectus TaxID=200917 RepID=A0A9P0LPQ3_ACAOB|nr:unnamed protein product [Acanthoscelides obtectus]